MGTEDKNNFSHFLIETKYSEELLDLQSSLLSCNQIRSRSPSISKLRLVCYVIFFLLFQLLAEFSSFINR